MAANVWNYLAGYVIINIEGEYHERLINHIIHSEIEIWDIKRSRKGVCLSVGIGGFYRLRHIAREYTCRIRILEKRGLTVALCHMGSRYVMVFGWILAVGVLLAGSRFIWIIDIEGCSGVDEADVRKVLAQEGISSGVRRGNLDTAAAAAAVKNSDSRIAWAGAQLTGVVLQISVKEAEEGAEVYIKGKPCSIYASESGVITSVTALSGRPLVVAGEAVQAGEELIGGRLESGTLTEARGSVTAKVLHSFSHFSPWEQEMFVPTGEKQNGLWIELNGKTLLPCIPPYEEYRIGQVYSSTFTSILPITVCRAEYSRIAGGSGIVPKEKLMEITRAGAESQIHDSLPPDAAIVSKNTRFVTDDAGMTCTILLTAEQNIAIIGEILPDDQLQ